MVPGSLRRDNDKLNRKEVNEAMPTRFRILRDVSKERPVRAVGSWEKIRLLIVRSLWRPPKPSLMVLLKHERSHCWRMGEVLGKPAMQIMAEFYLTNITQEDVFVLKTYFVPYHGWFPSILRAQGNVLLKDQVVGGENPYKHKIPPGVTYEGHAVWGIQPPIKSEGQPLAGRACFVDHFGNEHRTAVIEWKFR